MNIRQSIAMIYGITALGIAAAAHFAPGIAGAEAPPARVLPAEIEPSMTGHAEIDDLPAYLTEGPGDAGR